MSRVRWIRRGAKTAIAMVAAALAAAAHAETVTFAQAMARPGVHAVLADIDAGRDAADRLLVDIGGIVSPSGKEHARAVAVKAEMERSGLRDVRMDDLPNVTGVIPGQSGKALVFVSTLDDLATVAGHQRAAGRPPRVEGGRVVGPGTNTSSTTVAMLMAARALVAAGIKPEHDLVFAAVAQ